MADSECCCGDSELRQVKAVANLCGARNIRLFIVFNYVSEKY